MKSDDKMREEYLANRTHIVDECEGCENIVTDYCKCYICPAAMWRRGNCARFFDPTKEIEKKKKKFVNPIKWSKRRGIR